jgi:hypothetical protein
MLLFCWRGITRRNPWLHLKRCGSVKQRVADISTIRIRATEKARFPREYDLKTSPMTGNARYVGPAKRPLSGWHDGHDLPEGQGAFQGKAILCSPDAERMIYLIIKYAKKSKVIGGSDNEIERE